MWILSSLVVYSCKIFIVHPIRPASWVSCPFPELRRPLGGYAKMFIDRFWKGA